jgi:hypothetical protein
MSITSWCWPVGGFLAALGLHIAWRMQAQGASVMQDRWVAVPVSPTPWYAIYLRSGDIWLGLSLGAAIAFAAWAISRWHRRRSAAGAAMALGGLTWGGALAAGGCFLTGCCGSPMLAVWLSLLGATAIPWIKPLSFGVSLATIGFGIWWIRRQDRRRTKPECADAGCACHQPGRSRGITATTPRRHEERDY